MSTDYEAPCVTVIGTVHELTLRTKDFGSPPDGDRLNGKKLTTISGGP
jgi:hypothetical protein